MAVAAEIQVDDLIEELRALLRRVDAVLDHSLPDDALREAQAAHDQIVELLDDFLDTLEIEEALQEAGAERVSWDQFQAEQKRT